MSNRATYLRLVNALLDPHFERYACLHLWQFADCYCSLMLFTQDIYITRRRLHKTTASQTGSRVDRLLNVTMIH